METKKLIVICAAVTMVLAIGSTALAGVSGWQTTPILGTDSSYDGDVHINNGASTWANIPHDVLDGPGQPIGITTFTVGESVHSGSGVWMGTGANDWTSIFTGPSRTLSYSGSYTPGDDFFMIWNTPAGDGDGLGVANLTAADLGDWTYVETWTNGTDSINNSTDFTVVPEPVTMALLGLGGLGVLRRRRA